MGVLQNISESMYADPVRVYSIFLDRGGASGFVEACHSGEGNRVEIVRGRVSEASGTGGFKAICSVFNQR